MTSVDIDNTLRALRAICGPRQYSLALQLNDTAGMRWGRAAATTILSALTRPLLPWFDPDLQKRSLRLSRGLPRKAYQLSPLGADQGLWEAWSQSGPPSLSICLASPAL